MKNNIKGIFTGTVFIIISILLMQLLFILLAVAYNSIAIEYPFLNDLRWVFKYILGVPVFVSIMVLGGYITSEIAKSKSILNSVIVGSIVVLSMMWSALANAELTLTGATISLVMISAVVFGGVYFKKNN